MNDTDKKVVTASKKPRVTWLRVLKIDNLRNPVRTTSKTKTQINMSIP